MHAPKVEDGETGGSHAYTVDQIKEKIKSTTKIYYMITGYFLLAIAFYCVASIFLWTTNKKNVTIRGSLYTGLGQTESTESMGYFLLARDCFATL